MKEERLLLFFLTTTLFIILVYRLYREAKTDAIKLEQKKEFERILIDKVKTTIQSLNTIEKLEAYYNGEFEYSVKSYINERTKYRIGFLDGIIIAKINELKRNSKNQSCNLS